ISPIFASTALSPSAFSASAFSSRARSFMAARSSAVNPLDFLIVAVLLSAIAKYLRVFWLTQLLDADQVARGVAGGAVANAVGLLGRLLNDLGVAGLQPLEGGVEVGGGQVDAGEGALGHHFGDHAALVLGDAGRGGRRVQDDRRTGLVRRPDRNPVHAA